MLQKQLKSVRGQHQVKTQMEATGGDVTEKKAGLTRKRQKKRNCENKETRKVEAAKKTFHLEKGNNLNDNEKVWHDKSN